MPSADNTGEASMPSASVARIFSFRSGERRCIFGLGCLSGQSLRLTHTSRLPAVGFHRACCPWIDTEGRVVSGVSDFNRSSEKSLHRMSCRNPFGQQLLVDLLGTPRRQRPAQKGADLGLADMVFEPQLAEKVLQGMAGEFRKYRTLKDSTRMTAYPYPRTFGSSGNGSAIRQVTAKSGLIRNR